MGSKSRTDWKRLAAMPDEEIDTSDIAELGDDFFRQATLRAPAKKPITLRVDTDVLEWFKSQGKGYQSRINALLRAYMDSQASDRR